IVPNFGRAFGISFSPEQRTLLFLRNWRNDPLRLGFFHATSSKAAGNDHVAPPAPTEVSVRPPDALHCRRRRAWLWKRRSAELLPLLLPTGRPAELARDAGA